MNPSDSRYGLLRFRFLIRNSRWPPHHRNGSPALGNKSSRTCRPCYPGSRCRPLPLFPPPSNGLPLLTTGSAAPLCLRGYSWVHLRYGLLSCCGKLTTLRYRNAASSCYRGARTTPRTGLQPARLAAVTAYGQTTVFSGRKQKPGSENHLAGPRRRVLPGLTY